MSHSKSTSHQGFWYCGGIGLEFLLRLWNFSSSSCSDFPLYMRSRSVSKRMNLGIVKSYLLSSSFLQCGQTYADCICLVTGNLFAASLFHQVYRVLLLFVSLAAKASAKNLSPMTRRQNIVIDLVVVAPKKNRCLHIGKSLICPDISRLKLNVLKDKPHMLVIYILE